MKEQSTTLAYIPVVGAVLLGILGLLGFAGLVVGSSYGVPRWLLDIYFVLAIGILGLYVAFVLQPTRKFIRRSSHSSSQAEHAEQVFGQVLQHLQAGDLVSAQVAARQLPPRLEPAFLAAARAVGTLVQQIQASSVDVAVAGQQVQNTASELASGSSEQAAAVVEITATMEELARTAAQIATNAANQAELAAHAEEAGTVGAAAVEDAVRGVEAVQKRISAIASRADSLGARSREIYRVLDLITEIAQETHILALNAAIEATAAGEHGRRFSVVADEVRRLAERSRESVDSVRTLLEEFSASIRATVVATEESSKEVATVLERARAAAASIEQLRGALGETSRAAREISLATHQQRTASDQVVLTLKEVSQVIQRMAEGLKAFSATAERLSQLALSIQLLTQSFHLDTPRSVKHIAQSLAETLGAEAGHWEALDSTFTQAMKQHRFVETAFLADPQGNLVAVTPNPDLRLPEGPLPVSVGQNLADRPWFQAVMRDQRTTLTPVYTSLLTGEKCFTVAAPVRDPHNRLVGVLGLDVNASSWTKIVA
ncbi:MAG: methyl-accepting chemotaxis protein [Thermoanaerobaculum sp.]|nr:methyl-accepting chemotaxis protein [Thermoanaerobaculum sp.]MDW7967365.1 methyl-accepting chemotaxis protein [Thermoanaerobaculum sp.]